MKTTYLGPWVDPKEYKNLVISLKPEPGVCIFLDICDSTLVKNSNPLSYWITVIRNTISIGQTLPSLSQPLKLIGDEIMYYVPDSELKYNGTSYTTLFESVDHFMSSWGSNLDNCIMKLKGAIHHCTDVYPISFIGSVQETQKGQKEIVPTRDFYGSGIDLTARLMKHAKEKLLVISDDFLRKARSTDPEFLLGINEYGTETFKGFNEETGFWKYRVK